MKKIGILTHYFHSKNIGGLLQAYALTNVLCSNNQRAEQISFNFHFYDKASRKLFNKLFPQKNTLTRVLKYPFRQLQSLAKKILLGGKISLQNTIFLEFEQFMPHSDEIYNTLNISKATPNYDIVIIGSDQVFASYLLPLSAYYGEFADKDKKVISYAASSDVKVLPPKAENLFKQKLKRLNKISVREKTLKDYIERITDKKADVVLDPTFLLSKQEWLKIANPAVVPNKKYIFCYFLGGKSAWQRKAARAYADKYGYELLHLPYIMQNIRPADIYLKGQGRYDVGPREFISLINGAECIFTDSFHGMAFSINFNKDFYVFNRDDKDGINSMTSRITDTLSMLGLTERHIKTQDTVLEKHPINYTHANTILLKQKEFSVNWLLNALKD
ncbi:polysaccharide pyruvyl transferase family protein [Candidatus Proelusimicrobium excrementi]|uniref:polysaccharide pyruvyl transferase family protein n=1 Tax=Candidatus Proelusimicrobium excrementi TaxID=3416222 RepID=UPI003CA3C1B7|nr:polysaccharide pyruvyl transferase family protein [Elusimicrobiaceae bacterium]